MSRGAGSVHVSEQANGTFQALWGPVVLKSAFQPIFRFAGGRLEVEAYEGLIRPFRNGAEMPPSAFFRSVPASDRLHVEMLTRKLHLLNAARFLDPATLLFLNFDPSVFVDREMTEIALRDMRLTLQTSHIDPRRIVCEVTEQKTTSEHALAVLVAALRDHGFRIAVDDYGAQDSDMQRVAALRPDIVKFDAQWISRLMNSRQGTELLSLMVRRFSVCGITVVFEGLEEPRQLKLAEQAGADLVQGYVLARPELAPTSFAVVTRSDPVNIYAVKADAQVAAHNDCPVPTRKRTGRVRPFGRLTKWK